jgi:hypothetical protein
MRRPRLTRLAAFAVGSVVVLMCFVACGGSSGSARASDPARPATPSVSSTPTSPLVQNSLPPATAIANDVGKRKSVTLTKCAAIEGGWSASGTASNPGTTAVDYAITVFFTNAAATVQDFTTASVTVAPGQSLTWTASKQFAAASTTSCVLRGVG